MVVYKKVVWDKVALTQLKEAYTYLKEKSEPAANKVRYTIINETKSLNKNPEVYELDRFKKVMMEVFELLKYTVIVLLTELQILKLEF